MRMCRQCTGSTRAAVPQVAHLSKALDRVTQSTIANQAAQHATAPVKLKSGCHGWLGLVQ
eukprot:4533349-Amphidinium_carterae.2